ncbi:MAG: hypothetical protein KDA75_03655 [Planctomycetaceae bacterium]|nr:hypothetical protein [Planctomycetaceae bacterium]
MNWLFGRSDVGVVLLLGGIVLAGHFGDPLVASLGHLMDEIASRAASAADVAATNEAQAEVTPGSAQTTRIERRPQRFRIVTVHTAACPQYLCGQYDCGTGCH